MIEDFIISIINLKYLNSHLTISKCNALINICSSQVLQSDGGNYCASVNAATLAVIDAGIPMKDYVCACSASYIKDKALLDINYVEESSGRSAELIVATLPKWDQIVLLEMNGRLHEDHLSQVLDTAVKGCKDVYAILDAAVREHVTEAATALNLNT